MWRRNFSRPTNIRTSQCLSLWGAHSGGYNPQIRTWSRFLYNAPTRQVLSFCVYSFGRYRVDKQTNKQTSTSVIQIDVIPACRSPSPPAVASLSHGPRDYPASLSHLVNDHPMHYDFSVFGIRGLTPGPQFTKTGDDLAESEIYHSAKFHRSTPTHARDICYQNPADGTIDKTTNKQ